MTGSTRFHSEELNMPVDLNLESGEYTIDGIIYFNHEAEIIKSSIGKITPDIHNCKKMFDAIIFNIEDNNSRLSSRKVGYDIKLNHDTGSVIVNMKKPFGDTSKYVMYNKSECAIIKKNLGEIDKQTHLMKTLFDGEIVEPPPSIKFTEVKKARIENNKNEIPMF